MTPELYRDLYNEEVSRHEETLSGYRQQLLKELADFSEGTLFDSPYRSVTIRMVYFSDQYIHSDYFLDPEHLESSIMYIMDVEHSNGRRAAPRMSQRDIREGIRTGEMGVISKGKKQ